MEMKKITVGYLLEAEPYNFKHATLEMFITEEQFEEYVSEMMDECFYMRPICGVGNMVKETLQRIAKISGTTLNTFEVVEVEHEVRERIASKKSTTLKQAVLKELWS